MSDPVAVNQMADAINTALQKSVSDTSVIVENIAEGYLTWLKLPIIKQLFEMLVGWIGQYFYKDMASGATALVIDIQKDSENSKAKAALAALQTATLKGDQNAIDKASSDFDNAYANLVHYGGSATTIK